MRETQIRNHKSKIINSISLRRELAIALFAAMETCWTYVALALLATIAGTHILSPLAIFAGYWVAMLAGRALPHSRQRWIVLQFAAIAIAVVTILAGARIELYERLAPSDLSWLPRFVVGLLSLQIALSAERLLGLGILFAFIRGLGYAQRPLTLWFTGFRFRVGIVIFLFLLLAASFIPRLDFTIWIFAYFAVSLLAIALARIEEMSEGVPLGARWAITLVAAIALVIFLGAALLQIFTLNTASALLIILWPLWALFGIFLMLLAIPAAYLAEWLVNFLRPLYNTVGQLLDRLQNLVPSEWTEQMQKTLDTTTVTNVLIPLLKTIGILVVVIGIGYLLARALNRRMAHAEDEQYVRESISADEDAVRRADLARKTRTHPFARNLSAESIRRIYASLVARARDAGLPRQVAETPYEYLPRLAQEWHTESDDLHAITEAYVATHYAERDLSGELARVRDAWKRVEKVLRDTKNKKDNWTRIAARADKRG
ncbi:hypothetical protein ANRL1_00052 [Anaerolineae bacterium]|nr:hypothetical protein ANRL1_00052 [Anaerolineae bacterium]